MDYTKTKTMKTNLIEKYKEIISEYTGVRPSEFNTKTNKTPYVLSRQLLHYFLRKEQPHLSLSQIAEITDKNHATAIHSINTIERYYQTNDDVIRNVKGFKRVLDNMAVHVKAETVKYSDEKALEAIEGAIVLYKKEAMKNKLFTLKEKGFERSYSISEFGTIFLSVKKINEREKEFITINLINNYISIVSKETLFRLMPYFYDFFTEIAEGHGKLDNEILIAILENLGITEVKVNQYQTELVN